MLLSIGMIVKNEEKYLEKCLTALKPILENVDSELIIADTGSTDDTVEIAKKFTDKVYYFEWINDFSAARNFTMEKSVGEWFMFLDADEIFQSCDEIIRFFNSGEYKVFATAAYKIRSYTEENNLNKYIDTLAIRLSKRFSDVRFVNKVHEALSPTHQPIKMLNDIVDHYGYFFTKDEAPTEQAYIKSRRNLELLLESLNSPYVDFSVYKEIADCYNIIGDAVNSLKYINMGLDILDHKNIGITQYFSEKAVYMYNNENFNELIEVCEQYFSERTAIHNKPIATDIDMYALLGAGYFFTKDYEKAFESYTRFFPLYKDYENGKLNTLDLIYSSIKINDLILGRIYTRFLLSCINLKKYHTALEKLKTFPVDSFQSDKNYMTAHFSIRAEIMDHTGWKSVKKFISLLDDENKKLFFRALRKRMFYTDKTDELLKVLADFKETVPFAEDVIGIYRSYFITKDLQFEQMKKFTEKYGSDDNTDILCIMLSCGMDISDFLTAADFNAEKTVHSFYSEFADKTSLLEELNVNLLSADAVTNAASLFGWAMAETLSAGKNITRIFEQNGKIAAKWVSEFPNEENIPADICAGIIVHGITEARKKKDYNTCINQMEMLVNACPDFEPFVSEYRKEIEQEITPKMDARTEFLKMAETVKQNIRVMLDAGDITSAEKNLIELEKLCPADAEIGILKYEIKKRKMC